MYNKEHGVSNMNIDFLVDKENKRVVVSNEKGTMKPREYQDNIKKVLIKEDVVEELESDYEVLEINRTSLEGRLEATNKKIEENLKKRKSFILSFITALIGLPVYMCILEYFVNMYSYQIGLIEIKTIVYTWLVSSGAVGFIGGFLALSPDAPFFKNKRLKNEKREYENYLEDLSLEMVDLVQVITKNKAELQELIEQKEKNNIEMMSDEVQKISYRKELELERSYLTQLREENIIENKQEMDRKDSILGRFKKKKQY